MEVIGQPDQLVMIMMIWAKGHFSYYFGSFLLEYLLVPRDHMSCKQLIIRLLRR